MLISEIYTSRQGEGLLTGTPSVFVRTSGCNLRCGFCDTPFASWEPEGESLSVPEILERIHQVAEDARHLVLTGGEPMLPKEVVELCEQVRQAGFHITIETAGTVFQSLACDLMSISPKLANSDPEPTRAGRWRERHQQTRHRPEIVAQLITRHDYQLKFVVDRPDDLAEIRDYLDQIPNHEPSRVLLMPQGIDSSELEARQAWLEPICEQHGYRFCQRLHIFWYGNRRGT